MEELWRKDCSLLAGTGRGILLSEFFDLDFIILKFLNQYFYSDLASLLLLIIASVYGGFILLFCFFFVNKQRSKLIQLILTLVIGCLLIVSMKYLIGRPRPYQLFPEVGRIVEGADPSFPSTHAFYSSLCFAFIPKQFRKFLFPLAIYLLILIPFGLIYTGVHYLSDVIVGVAIGLLMPRIISERFTNNLSSLFFKMYSLGEGDPCH